MWGTDPTRFYTERERLYWFFGAVDHYTTEVMGWHVAKIGDRWAALEPIRQWMTKAFGTTCEGPRRGISRAVVHVPPARIGALRETLSRRRHFVAVRLAEVNAVKRLLRAAGLGHLSNEEALRVVVVSSSRVILVDIMEFGVLGFSAPPVTDSAAARW